METLNITDSVLQRLADAIRGVNGSVPEDACFRLSLDSEENLALGVDVPAPDDQKFKHNDNTVLVMSENLAERFAGRTLDVNAAGDFVLT